MIRFVTSIRYNSIIAFNRGNGVWGDNISRITASHDCLYDNRDGLFFNCDPRLGILKRRNARKDSVDGADTLIADPVFAGSSADSVAREKDLSRPTEQSRMRDTTLAHVMAPTPPDSSGVPSPSSSTAARLKKYALSRYSPCIDAGVKDRFKMRQKRSCEDVPPPLASCGLLASLLSDFAFNAERIAFDVDHDAVVEQTIQDGGHDDGIAEEFSPVAEGLVRSNDR
jgi:hypothetical protein